MSPTAARRSLIRFIRSCIRKSIRLRHHAWLDSVSYSLGIATPARWYAATPQRRDAATLASRECRDADSSGRRGLAHLASDRFAPAYDAKIHGFSAHVAHRTARGAMQCRYAIAERDCHFQLPDDACAAVRLIAEGLSESSRCRGIVRLVVLMLF